MGKISSTGSASIISVELDPGSYKIEVWGAQGGDGQQPYIGGYGGYSTGILNCKTKMTLYGVIGQTTKNQNGGFNGGGSGNQLELTDGYVIAYGGGGATHIGFIPGLLSALQSEYSSHFLFVAGGGGGAIYGPVYDAYCQKLYLRVGNCGGGCVGQNNGVSYNNNNKKTKWFRFWWKWDT